MWFIEGKASVFQFAVHIGKDTKGVSMTEDALGSIDGIFYLIEETRSDAIIYITGVDEFLLSFFYFLFLSI